ncbi:histidine phosphatase family protein [Lacticaseibacillus baoqingensis]|uniref:Histidine phosphatase family protein n=1 Tax=Lacticaseibacillus baoqingensis TaxID=2486013 RepID=A0ABW4E7T0_9LACO|nr:histidine phosphatase family protein [Lacticaseibacillus baoqingensis]
MATFTVYLVRHGHTWLNACGRMQGWINSFLTEKGKKQAIQTGKMLADIHFNRVYTSDSARTQETASLILENNNCLQPQSVISDSSFREVYYGGFEGELSSLAWRRIGAPVGMSLREDLYANFGDNIVKNMTRDADPMKSAENASMFWKRLNSGLLRLRNEAVGGERILLVSHGNTIRSLVAHYGATQGFIPKSKPENGSVTKLLVTENTVYVLSYDQHSVCQIESAL